MKYDVKVFGIASLVLVSAILIALHVSQKDIDAQLFKNTDFASMDMNKSWESFKKDLDIQGNRSKIENFELILEENQIYSVNFDLINENKDEFTMYRYMECLLCEEGEKDRDIFMFTKPLENGRGYSDLMDADQFFETLNRLKQEDIIQKMNEKYKMIAADGYNEEIGVEGEYYILKNNGIHRIEKSKDGTYSGYSLHVMGNKIPQEFGTSVDSISIFFDGKSK